MSPPNEERPAETGRSSIESSIQPSQRSTRPPFIEDAIIVLEGLFRDAANLEIRVLCVVDALADLDHQGRLELGKAHPVLVDALLLLEDYANRHVDGPGTIRPGAVDAEVPA